MCSGQGSLFLYVVVLYLLVVVLIKGVSRHLTVVWLEIARGAGDHITDVLL